MISFMIVFRSMFRSKVSKGRIFIIDMIEFQQISAKYMMTFFLITVLIKEKSKSPSITENDLSTSEHHKILSTSPSSTVLLNALTSHSSSMDCHLHQITNKLPTVLDDNTSFFSSNSFQKLTAPPSSHLNHNHIGDNEDATEEESHPGSILTDTLPNISTTEDWAAAFGFPRPAEPIVDVIGERNIV